MAKGLTACSAAPRARALAPRREVGADRPGKPDQANHVQQHDRARHRRRCVSHSTDRHEQPYAQTGIREPQTRRHPHPWPRPRPAHLLAHPERPSLVRLPFHVLDPDHRRIPPQSRAMARVHHARRHRPSWLPAVVLGVITPATKIRRNTTTAPGPDGRSRLPVDQELTTESTEIHGKRMRINSPFPCPSVLRTFAEFSVVTRL